MEGKTKLRDQFALAVLPAAYTSTVLKADAFLETANNEVLAPPTLLAKMVWEIADAMMHERNEKE